MRLSASRGEHYDSDPVQRYRNIVTAAIVHQQASETIRKALNSSVPDLQPVLKAFCVHSSIRLRPILSLQVRNFGRSHTHWIRRLPNVVDWKCVTSVCIDAHYNAESLIMLLHFSSTSCC